MGVKKIEFANFLLKNGTSIFVTNELGQRWELIRNGVSTSDVEKEIHLLGKTEAIKNLIENKKLLPVFGGELNIE